METPLNTSKVLAPTPNLHRLSQAALCIALAGLTGCATTPQPPEHVVRQLATQRWQAILSNQHNRAYEFTNPAYRALRTKEQYVQSKQANSVKWTSAEVVRVTCQSNTCQVAIKTSSQIKMPTFFKGPLVSGLDETWIYEHYRWWKLEKL